MEERFHFIDTHAHLYVKEFAEDREEMLRRAVEHGVKKIYLPNIDITTIDSMLALESTHPELCFAMIGLHPCSVKDDYKEQLAVIHQWLERRTFAAIGETGTDLYWDKTFIGAQTECLEQHIAWARDYKRPIVLHSRDTLELNIDIIKSFQDGSLSGVFHCFTGSKDQAKEIIDLGFMLGIGGVVTFKNATIGDVVRDIPLESIVLETDSPYLSPAPHRGKRNESAYLHLVAEKIAQVRGVDVKVVAEVTTANAERLFA
jgi:TatD DNase family protein